MVLGMEPSLVNKVLCIAVPLVASKAVRQETNGRWRYLVYPAFALLAFVVGRSQNLFATAASELAFVGLIVTLKHIYAEWARLLWRENYAELRKQEMIGFIKKETPRLDDFVAKYESSSDFGLMYDVLTSHEITSTSGRLHWSH